MRSPRPAHHSRSLTLVHHLEGGSTAPAEQSALLGSTLKTPAAPSLNCHRPPGTRGEKHVHLARLSGLRADLSRAEGACERSQSILLETLAATSRPISAARQDRERHCFSDTLPHVPVTWLQLCWPKDGQYLSMLFYLLLGFADFFFFF